MRVFVFIILYLTAPSWLFANTISGQNSTVFQHAVKIWLDDNDADSLPVLKNLAVEGNRAAQLFLGRIEITDRAPSKFVQSLSRDERLSLFRPETSKRLPPTWIKENTNNGDAFAEALLDAMNLGLNIEAIKTLHQFGEKESTEYLIRKAVIAESTAVYQELREILDHDHEMMPYVNGFQFIDQGNTTGKAALSKILDEVGATTDHLQLPYQFMLETYIDIGYQAGNIFSAKLFDSPGIDHLYTWLNQFQPAQPLLNLCKQYCASDQLRSCAVHGFGLMGGYYEFIRIDSPLESIVSQSDFLHSQRAMKMTLRKIIAARTESSDAIFSATETHERSQCLAQAMLTPGA